MKLVYTNVVTLGLGRDLAGLGLSKDWINTKKPQNIVNSMHKKYGEFDGEYGKFVTSLEEYGKFVASMASGKLVGKFDGKYSG
jgi:hypothetical protein